MEGATERLAAEEHGGLSSPVGLGRHLGRIHHAFYVEVREKAGREASPTAAILDSQSAKARSKRGLARSIGL